MSSRRMQSCLGNLLNFVGVTMKHEDARRRVCLGCFSKTNIEIASLPPNVQELIEKHIFSNYNINDYRLPCGICKSCRSKLHKVENGDRRNSFDLEQISRNIESVRRISPRSESCTCFSCAVANATGLAAKAIIQKHKSKVGRPAEKPIEIIHDLCGRCLSPKYRGCNHTCNQTTLLQNLLTNVKRQMPHKS